LLARSRKIIVELRAGFGSFPPATAFDVAEKVIAELKGTYRNED
jgi:hypothetical protein